MKIKKYLKFTFFATALFLFSAVRISTVQASVITRISIPGHAGNTYTDYWEYINTIYAFSMKIGIGLTVLMIIYAGYLYMTSQGNPTKINEGKDIIIGSLTGFAMLLLVYFILKVIGMPTTPPS